jgi:hypothetical protein
VVNIFFWQKLAMFRFKETELALRKGVIKLSGSKGGSLSRNKTNDV